MSSYVRSKYLLQGLVRGLTGFRREIFVRSKLPHVPCKVADGAVHFRYVVKGAHMNFRLGMVQGAQLVRLEECHACAHSFTECLDVLKDLRIDVGGTSCPVPGNHIMDSLPDLWSVCHIAYYHLEHIRQCAVVIATETPMLNCKEHWHVRKAKLHRRSNISLAQAHEQRVGVRISALHVGPKEVSQHLQNTKLPARGKAVSPTHILGTQY